MFYKNIVLQKNHLAIYQILNDLLNTQYETFTTAESIKIQNT